MRMGGVIPPSSGWLSIVCVASCSSAGVGELKRWVQRNRKVPWTLLASVLALAACHGSTDPAGPPGTTSAEPEYSAFFEMSAPLQPEQVDVDLMLQDTPWLSADGQWVYVDVVLINRGAATLSSHGAYPVRLGAKLLDGALAGSNLAHSNLPNPLPPKNSEAITIRLSTAALIGHRVSLLPVQQRAGRFDQWDTDALTLGPFSNCTQSGAPEQQTLCGDLGKPLPQASD